MNSEELTTLRNKIESGTCTPLELHNIQMYVALNIGDGKVLERVIKKEIKYQNYLAKIEENKSRIKISRWQDGTHFYAKVDGNDVVDEDGNVKWSSYGRAMKECENYINNLN